MGRSNKRTNTNPELLLRRALWLNGLRYRLHAHDVIGAPDILIRSAKVAIFCDGDFWHGRNWAERKARLAKGSNAVYWTAKIQRNIDRDHDTSRQLRRDGWLVIRVWEGNVRKDPQRVARSILWRVAKRRSSQSAHNQLGH
ncbi:MAG: very short patch repair endonuclease [Gemmatimonadaceae bacterium]